MQNERKSQMLRNFIAYLLFYIIPKDQKLQEVMGNGENVFTFWQKRR